MRIVTVEVTWRSKHEIEVPDDQDWIEPGDISTILQYEDVTSQIAEMVDWDIRDKGTA